MSPAALPEDLVMAMVRRCDGNPGAATALREMTHQAILRGYPVDLVLRLVEKADLRGSSIWGLYKDVCARRSDRNLGPGAAYKAFHLLMLAEQGDAVTFQALRDAEAGRIELPLDALVATPIKSPVVEKPSIGAVPVDPPVVTQAEEAGAEAPAEPVPPALTPEVEKTLDGIADAMGAAKKRKR